MPLPSTARPCSTTARRVACALVVACLLGWCGAARAQPDLDDRYQTRLPPRSTGSPLDDLDLTGGGGIGGGGGGAGEPMDVGGGEGDGSTRRGGWSGWIDRLKSDGGGDDDGSTRPRRRGDRSVFFDERFDPDSPPREGAVEWIDGRKRVYRDGAWSDLGPPEDGDVERRRDDLYARRFEDGQWGDWQPPPDGAVDWDDGWKRTFRDGAWSDWQAPEEGDVEPRGDRERVFRDGEWSDWEKRGELADKRERKRPHDVDSDDLARRDPMMRQSPTACECGGINLGGSLGGVGQAIFWIVLVIVLIGVLVLVARHLRNRKSTADDDLEDEDDDLLDDDDEDDDEIALTDAGTGSGDALLAALQAPLPDHERLAAEGRWAEALHALLLHVLAGLLEGRPLRTKASLTSRELVDRFGLDDDARDALSRIVRAVEVSHFGMRPTTREHYETARRDAERVQAAVAPTREAA